MSSLDIIQKEMDLWSSLEELQSGLLEKWIVLPTWTATTKKELVKSLLLGAKNFNDNMIRLKPLLIDFLRKYSMSYDLLSTLLLEELGLEKLGEWMIAEIEGDKINAFRIYSDVQNGPLKQVARERAEKVFAMITKS